MDLPLSQSDDEDIIDLDDLQDFLKRVLVPVARGILTHEEFQDAWVSAEPELGEMRVHARVLAGGDAWAQTIWVPGQAVDTYAGLAEIIADSLQDFVAESEFAWGQLRTAHYTIPPREHPRAGG